MSKSVLVAGGAGYIGAHVCKKLAAEGYTPVVLDNLCTGHRDFVRWGTLVEACVSDSEAVAATVKQHKIEAVIDLAGSIEVAESVADPAKYYTNNFVRKLPFLQTLKAGGVRAFVLSSTAAVYGEPIAVPIQETHPLQPKNPYGWSKRIYEQFLQDFHQTSGPAWMALRYFNASGASLDGDIGEAHEPESHLIPRACMAALGKAPALEIYGNDYPTPDGTALRDYIHVEDLASAHVLAVEALLQGKPSAAYNLGNGVGTSIGEILACFTSLGVQVPHVFKPRRPGDPVRLVADSTAAMKNLGWIPRHADINVIVSSAYNWHKSQLTSARAS